MQPSIADCDSDCLLCEGGKFTEPDSSCKSKHKVLECDSVESGLVFNLDSRYVPILGISRPELHDPQLNWRYKTTGPTCTVLNGASKSHWHVPVRYKSTTSTGY